MTRASRVALAGLALASLAVGAQGVHANPQDYFGFGARAMGMGGAFGALADDFSATFYDPAGLATQDTLRLDIGYKLVEPSLTLDGHDLDVDSVHGVEGGVTLPGHAWGHRVALALGLYLPDARVTRLRALPESQARFALYDNNPQRLVLTTSAALEILKDRLFVGLGLTYLSDTGGRLNLTGQVDFQSAAGTELASAVDVDFKAARYLSASVLVLPTPDLRLSLTFRDEFDLSLDIGVVVHGNIVTDGATTSPTVLVPNASLTIVSKNSNLYSPLQLSLGAAWTLDRWTLAAELTWYQWSEFKTPTAQLETDLDAGTLPISIPPNPAPADPNFHDILVPRIGAEVRVVDGAHAALDVRGGAWFEASPAPEQSGVTNFADSDKIGCGLGLTLTIRDVTDIFPRPFALDVGGMFIALLDRDHHKTDPADPVGDYVSGGSFLGFASDLRFAF